MITSLIVLGWFISWGLSVFLFCKVQLYSYDLTRADLLFYCIISLTPVSLPASFTIWLVERPTNPSPVLIKKSDN